MPQHIDDIASDRFDDTPSDYDRAEAWDTEPMSDGRRLRVVESAGEGAARYDPASAAAAAAAAIRIRTSVDPPTFKPAPASARVKALIAAWFVPLRWRDTVYVVPRTSADPAAVPGGGVLLNIDSGYIRQRVGARFARMTCGKEVPSKGAISDGIAAFAGTATTIESTPYTRWGRGDDGSLWWDSGGEFVHVGERGWSVETEPGAYFLRPPGQPMLPLPEHGGSIDELWAFARVAEPDRDLVLAWMLQQADPDYESACPLLYLTGQHGAAKSTAATVIAMACGDSIERDVPKGDLGDKPHEFMVSLAGGHITLLDNLSHLSSAASDTLCVAVTGGTSRQRKLFTDSDLVYLRLRKPMMATSIDLGIVRDDLAERMIPVRLPVAPSGTERKSETRLMAAFRQARPGIFGALLDLMAEVLAADEPQVPLPRLAAFGETAARLDAVTGSASLARLEKLLGELAQRAVAEDVFWSAVYDALGQNRWTGTCSGLLAVADPDGDLAVKHRRGGWPQSARTISQRMERIAPTLRAVGWEVTRNAPAATNRALTWTICPHPGHDGCPAGCEQLHISEPPRSSATACD